MSEKIKQMLPSSQVASWIATAIAVGGLIFQLGSADTRIRNLEDRVKVIQTVTATQYVTRPEFALVLSHMTSLENKLDRVLERIMDDTRDDR